jgi:hypothetical protein
MAYFLSAFDKITNLMTPFPDSEKLPARVIISDPAKLNFWCMHFGCTSGELIEALQKMGNCRDEVGLFLMRSPRRGKDFGFWSSKMES